MILNTAARGLARALTAWLRPGSVPEPEQSVWQRGAIDTRRWANERAIPFTLWLALPGGAAAAAATLLTTGESIGVQIVAGALGALVGALVAVLAVLVVATAAAPIRQRDEARARLRAEDDPLPTLAHDLEAFAIASRAKAPRSGIAVLMQTIGMDRSDKARFMQERNAEADRAMRDMRGEYHDGFRARVLAALHKSGREPLLRAHGEVASDPRWVEDVEKLSRTISRLARAQAARPGVLESTDEAIRTSLADDMRQLASEMEGYLEERDKEAAAIEQQMLHRHRATQLTQADQAEIDRRVDEHRRRTQIAFYIEFRERALALFDRAEATGLVASDERTRIEHPHGELRPIGEWLRDLATDLDGQSS